VFFTKLFFPSQRSKIKAEMKQAKLQSAAEDQMNDADDEAQFLKEKITKVNSKKRKEQRIPVADLKQMVNRPDVVERYVKNIFCFLASQKTISVCSILLPKKISRVFVSFHFLNLRFFFFTSFPKFKFSAGTILPRTLSSWSL
jgi:hypothetical protein